MPLYIYAEITVVFKIIFTIGQPIPEFPCDFDHGLIGVVWCMTSKQLPFTGDEADRSDKRMLESLLLVLTPSPSLTVLVDLVSNLLKFFSPILFTAPFHFGQLPPHQICL